MSGIDKELVARLAEDLRSDSPSTRWNALYNLGNMKAVDAAKDIALLLRDREWCVRYKAIDVLGMMRAKEYAKDIVPLLKDQDSDVRKRAATALGELDAKEYVRNIALLLKDKDVRWSAVSVLFYLICELDKKKEK